MFPLGLFVELGSSYQTTPGVTYYGKVVGLMWSWRVSQWVYEIDPPDFHRLSDDPECLTQQELIDRLK